MIFYIIETEIEHKYEYNSNKCAPTKFRLYAACSALHKPRPCMPELTSDLFASVNPRKM